MLLVVDRGLRLEAQMILCPLFSCSKSSFKFPSANVQKWLNHKKSWMNAANGLKPSWEKLCQWHYIRHFTRIFQTGCPGLFRDMSNRKWSSQGHFMFEDVPEKSWAMPAKKSVLTCWCNVIGKASSRIFQDLPPGFLGHQKWKFEGGSWTAEWWWWDGWHGDGMGWDWDGMGMGMERDDYYYLLIN